MKNIYNDILTHSFLNREYVKNKKSITQIANKVGADWTTVKRYALSNKIKLRSHKEQATISSPGGKLKHINILTKDFFIKNYIELKKSIKGLSLETGIERTVIRRYMKRLKIPVRTSYEQMNISHPPKEFELTKNCVAFFDGLLMGDGSIPLRKGGKARSYTQCCKYREYLKYIILRAKKYGITFSPLLTRKRNDPRCKNGGYPESFLQTHRYRTFELMRKKWYNKSSIKHIPKDFIFNPDSMLQFYLCDGNFYREIKLCTDNFSLKDIIFLQGLFQKHLKIKSRIVKNNNGYEIAIKKSDNQKFLNYIGKCPVKCYEYKWQDNESEEKKLEKNKRARERYHSKKRGFIHVSK
ncbi:MAG: hypothetical protein V1818_03075 [Candidatus Aenigmatarchaeota archaeon]